MFRNLYSIHCIGHNLVIKHIPILPGLLKIVEHFLFPACDIPFSVEIGEGASFSHRAIGVTIHERCIIGKNVKIRTNVVIGSKENGNEVPRIGDNLLVGTGACILGDINIGDNAVIGAGAVVLHDIPRGCCWSSCKNN